MQSGRFSVDLDHVVKRGQSGPIMPAVNQRSSMSKPDEGNAFAGGSGADAAMLGETDEEQLPGRFKPRVDDDDDNLTLKLSMRREGDWLQEHLNNTDDEPQNPPRQPPREPEADVEPDPDAEEAETRDMDPCVSLPALVTPCMPPACLRLVTACLVVAALSP